MNRKTFSANLNPKDPFNCYKNAIVTRALNIRIPSALITTETHIGISSNPNNPKDCQRHHIYPTLLFHFPDYLNTRTIAVSEKRHLELHKLIAEERYAEYEAAIKAESRGTITDNIEQIFLDRIAAL